MLDLHLIQIMLMHLHSRIHRNVCMKIVKIMIFRLFELEALERSCTELNDNLVLCLSKTNMEEIIDVRVTV